MARLRAGQEILLSGVLYTARDQAHKKIAALLLAGKKPPFDIKDKIVYYCGPTATPQGRVIGACGPTTSSRMDAFTPLLLDNGLAAMIGKGRRSKLVRESCKKNGAVYLLAPAGCGALLAKKIVSRKLVAFGDLGPEAVYRLEAKELPLIVGIDTKGNAIYPDL